MDLLITLLAVIPAMVLGLLLIFRRDLIEKLRQKLYPYPFSSRPGDKMFPSKGDTLGWVAYISFMVAMLLFLSQIYLMIKTPSYEPPIWGILIFILFMLIGGFTQSFSQSK